MSRYVDEERGEEFQEDREDSKSLQLSDSADNQQPPSEKTTSGKAKFEEMLGNFACIPVFYWLTFIAFRLNECSDYEPFKDQDLRREETNKLTFKTREEIKDGKTRYNCQVILPDIINRLLKVVESNVLFDSTTDAEDTAAWYVLNLLQQKGFLDDEFDVIHGIFREFVQH